MNRSHESGELRIIPVPISGEIRKGDSLCRKILASLRTSKTAFRPGDILVLKHKIVSKAEGALVDLGTIRASAASKAWAKRYGGDSRVTELAMREAKRVVRRRKGVLITETRHGFVCANSGVDVSNVDGGTHALLLPQDADQSATKIFRELKQRVGISIPVLICDSWGRPWREGLIEAAIGVAGMKPLHDFRGLRDPHGYKLHASVDAVADELACAAGLVCGKLAGTPACVIRGFRYRPGKGSAKQLLRPAGMDLFR